MGRMSARCSMSRGLGREACGACGSSSGAGVPSGTGVPSLTCRAGEEAIERCGVASLWTRLREGRREMGLEMLSAVWPLASPFVAASPIIVTVGIYTGASWVSISAWALDFGSLGVPS
jgi:hypothetical protein